MKILLAFGFMMAFGASEPRVEIILPPSPVSQGSVEIVVDIVDSGSADQVQSVTIEGNMNHPGMVPVFAELKAERTSRYKGQLHLTMRGDWRITAMIKFADGRRLERHAELRGVK